jgi:outer membrane receptor protein involved in Fe transport
VTDQSGAVVPGAVVEATETATNVSHKSVTSSGGEFSFQELPLGTYEVTVTAGGFSPEKVNRVPVTAGVIYTLPVKLSVASAGIQTVEVSAAAYALDTTSTTQTTIIDEKSVDDTPLNGRDFTQFLALTPGFSDSGAGGYGSLNGTRANQINWQIDGVDNNDIWHNIPAVNQGGVSGIAGIVLPIDAVEQFSAQTLASPETGRNPGGTVTLGLKSGSNQLHGSAYYFDRNEALGAKSPFTSTKEKVRNYNWGVQAGGPFIKDKLFGIVTFEKQRFVIGVPTQATEPTTEWQTYAKSVIAGNDGTVNPVSTALLGLLWPNYALTSPASEATGPVIDNYNSPNPEFGYSYNGVAKIDYTINDRNTVSLHAFMGQGNQVAPVGSALVYYYEVAPIHVYNYQITYNHTFSPSLTNQLNTGVNYFDQVFNDSQTGFNAAGAGLVTGSPYTNAPELRITGFDPVGETPPEGRQDITGQVADNLSWVKGRHELKFGGEFRKIQLDEFYHRHAQGTFTFNGTEGNWDLSKSPLTAGITDAGTITRIQSLADFLSGDVYQSTITVGNPERLVYVNTLAFFGQDSFQITPKFNLNYGVRWDYEGPLHDSKKDLSVFRPSLGGIVTQGSEVSSLYNRTYANFSPRVGFSYQATKNTVVRGSFGLYYDTPNLNPFLDNRPGNAAPNGVEGNPTGSSPVTSLAAQNYVIQAGVNEFASAACSVATPCGVFSIAKNFKDSSNANYSLQIEQSLSPKVIAQVGFVGSQARHQLSIVDLNQAALQSAANQASPNSGLLLQESRPYFSAFPNYGNINEIQSIGDANYASLQTTLRASNIYHFSAQAAYTWSHSFDDVTAYRGALPQNSFDFKGDYGQSDFDSRNMFVGNLSYEVPGSQHFKAITTGWQANAKFAFHSGLPFSVFTDDQTDGTLEGTQRANQVGNPYSGAKQAKVGGQWLNASAFADPAAGTYGTSQRNAYVAPGYGDFDLSVFKNTKIGERVNTQLRFELFNLFNRTNFAPPLDSFQPNYSTISTLQLYDTIGDFNGAPGIGEGEPFNMQVGLKITF